MVAHWRPGVPASKPQLLETHAVAELVIELFGASWEPACGLVFSIDTVKSLCIAEEECMQVGMRMML
jgi:hypothetical protein